MATELLKQEKGKGVDKKNDPAPLFFSFCFGWQFYEKSGGGERCEAKNGSTDSCSSFLDTHFSTFLLLQDQSIRRRGAEERRRRFAWVRVGFRG